MTTQKSACNLFDKSYFKNIVKRTWSYGFICFIITFLCMPIPLLMNVNQLAARIARGATISMEEEIIEGISEGFVFLWIAFFALFAFVGAIMTFDFIINRKKAYLYHSFPEKRGTHFVCNTLAAFTWLLTATVFNVLVSFLVFAVNGALTGGVALCFISAVLRAVVYFALVFAIVALASVLTGQTAATVAMTAIICFLPICLYVAFEYIIYYDTMYSNFEDVSELFIYITPVVRVIMAADDMPFTVLEWFVTLAASLVLFVGAYFVYKHRKIESAGTPVIHAKLGEILKYLILFPLTFLSGVLFELLGNGDAWLFFGFFFGAFLGFIFINLFLYRNPSKMFYSAKWLGAFLAVFVVFFVVFGYNLLRHDRYVPDEDNVREVSISIENGNYTFKDQKIIASVIEYADDMIEDAISGNDFSGFVFVDIKTKLGFTYHKRIPICSYDGANELYGLLRCSEEYLVQHSASVKTIFESNAKIWVSLPVMGDFCYSFSVPAEIFEDAYLADMRDLDRYKTPLICTPYYSRSYLEIFEGDERTLEVLAQYVGFSGREALLAAIDEYVKNYLHCVTVTVNSDGAYLEDYYKELEKADYSGGYWQNTDKFVKTYTGEQAYEIYNSLRSYDYSANEYTYSSSDMTYDVEVQYILTNESYKEFMEKYPVNPEIDVNYMSYDERGIYTFSSVFMEDRVPSFVTTDFYSFAQ